VVKKTKLQIGLPVTSRELFAPERLFDVFAKSFNATISEATEATIYLGIDNTDEYFSERLPAVSSRLYKATGATIVPVILDGLEHKICAIWETLAMRGYRDGCDCFLFAGDDLEFRTEGWDEKLCRPLVNRGYGVEAFYDDAFPDFPTFPIFHRQHIDIFGRVFPQTFAKANQYGDPFLFELYRTVEAANLNRDVHCNNTVGGSGAARYEKQQPDAYRSGDWERKLLAWTKSLPPIAHTESSRARE
jgi:hypothetical protein